MRLVIAGIAVAILVVGYGVSRWLQPPQALCRLAIVPIGQFPSASARRLSQHFQQTLGLSVSIRPALVFDESMIDRSRGQLVGEEVIREMKRRDEEVAQDRRVMMIGLTQSDMYIRHKEWRFAFAYREGGRFAVVSTARMDPQNFQRPADEVLLAERLTKMTTKQIGLYLYGLPERREKSSVLYSPILGLDDLDEVASNFDAVDRQRMVPHVQACAAS